jgi:hypothetical protein
MTHSVDTYEDALLGYEDSMLVGLDLGAEGLAGDDPSRFSVDTYEEGLEPQLRFREPHRAAGAGRTHSVDTYEDSLLVGYELGLEGVAADDPSRYSVDTYEEGLEPWLCLGGAKTEPAVAEAAVGGHSVDTYEDSLLVGLKLAAGALAADDPSRYSVDTYEEGLEVEPCYSSKTGTNIKPPPPPAAAAEGAAAVAAAEAEAAAERGVTQSVDTYEDSLLVGLNAAAAALASNDPSRYSVDTYEEGLTTQLAFSENARAAAMPRAAGGAGVAAVGGMHSVDTYEDSLLEGWKSTGLEGAAEDPSRYSVDTYEEGLDPGLGFTPVVATVAAAAASGGRGLGDVECSVDTYEDCLLMGCDLGAEGVAADDLGRYSVDTHEEGLEPELRFQSQIGSDACHSVDTYDEALLLPSQFQAAAAAAAAAADIDPSCYSVDTYDVLYGDDFQDGAMREVRGPEFPAAAVAASNLTTQAEATAATAAAAAAASNLTTQAAAAAAAVARGESIEPGVGYVYADPLSSGESLEGNLNYEWGLQAAINAIRDATKSVDTYEDALDEAWEDLEPSAAATQPAATAGAGAAAAAGSYKGSMHSVDTYDDAVDAEWSAEAAVAEWDVTHSVDTYDDDISSISDPIWVARLSQSSLSSSAAAAAPSVAEATARAVAAAAAAAEELAVGQRSVDTYEESLGVDTAAAVTAAAEGADLGCYSMDTYEEAMADAIDSFSALRGSVAGGNALQSVDTYEEALQVGWDPAARAVLGRAVEPWSVDTYDYSDALLGKLALVAAAAGGGKAAGAGGGDEGTGFSRTAGGKDVLPIGGDEVRQYGAPAVGDDEAAAAAGGGDDDDGDESRRQGSDEQQLELMAAREVVAWSTEGEEKGVEEGGAGGRVEGEGRVVVEEEGATAPTVGESVAAAAAAAETVRRGSRGGEEAKQGEQQQKPKAGAWRGTWRPKVDAAAMEKLMEEEGGDPDE